MKYVPMFDRIDLHLGRLFGDEVVCLVSGQHPAVRRSWDAQGLARNITARCPHFGLIPAMVAGSLLVLTTGRQYFERFVDQLPMQILPCPVPFPRLMYDQLWHERTHASSAARWRREQIKFVAAALRCADAQTAAA